MTISLCSLLRTHLPNTQVGIIVWLSVIFSHKNSAAWEEGLVSSDILAHFNERCTCVQQKCFAHTPYALIKSHMFKDEYLIHLMTFTASSRQSTETRIYVYYHDECFLVKSIRTACTAWWCCLNLCWDTRSLLTAAFLSSGQTSMQQKRQVTSLYYSAI